MSIPCDDDMLGLSSGAWVGVDVPLLQVCKRVRTLFSKLMCLNICIMYTHMHTSRAALHTSNNASKIMCPGVCSCRGGGLFTVIGCLSMVVAKPMRHSGMAVTKMECLGRVRILVILGGRVQSALNRTR